MKRMLAAGWIAAMLGASTLPPQSAPPVAFVDVTVVAMTDTLAVAHRTVITRGDTIVTVGAADATHVPSDARRIDGRGKFLIPGLIDAHVHLMNAADLPQFLAYGVTSVRNLMGWPEVLEWRRAVANGLRPGPRIVTSGPLLAGAEVRWRNKVVPTTAEAARDDVRIQRAAGYDLIKIYDGLPAEAYAAALDEAHKLGMPVTGHIPQSVHTAGVLAAGQDVEHTDKLVFDVFGHTFDTTRLDSLARAIRRAGVFVTPTLASMEQLARVGSGGFDSLLSRPATRRAGAETISVWCEVTTTLRGSRQVPPGNRFNPWTDFQLKLVAAERRAGVPLVAGTDYPNAVLAPGSGLLEEMRALQDAGLSPVEALRAGTRTAALALRDSLVGIVAAGAHADLVLLTANPLADLSALEQRVGVMAAGRWWTQEVLDSLAPVQRKPVECHA